jgi:hypothetical protein
VDASAAALILSSYLTRINQKPSLPAIDTEDS